jgi:dTDP-4-amino-4,6-dideoxygalactose transaminase
VIHCRRQAVVADIDAQTWNLDPKDVERRITPLDEAIMPVHHAGRTCDMDALMAVARKARPLRARDCVPRLETSGRGSRPAPSARSAASAFYVTKNVVTGEGGMVLAKEQKDIERIRILALHGLL